MPDRTVSVSLVADMSNYLSGMQRGQTATDALGKKAQTTGQATAQFVGKIGSSISSLGNQVGGTVGGLLNTLGDGIDKVAGKSVSLSAALTVGGGAAIAAGIGLQSLGSEAVQATEQLNAAITASGESAADYTDKIEAAVTANENLGKSAEDTKAALTILIPAAGGTQQALDQMGVVANLAAAKHESLASAATAVARILSGSGARTLTQYGIHMDGVGSKTDQAKRALEQLSEKLDGQATASVDNFSGQVGVATTKVGDFIKDAAGPLGNVLSILGGAAEVAGVATELLAARAAKHAAAATVDVTATTAENAAIEEQTGLFITDEAAIRGIVEGNVAFATSADGVTTALKTQSVATATSSKGISTFNSVLGGVGLAAAALAGASAIGSLTDAALQNKIVFDKASDAGAAYAKQVQSINTTIPLSNTGKRAAALTNTTGAAGAIGNFAASIDLGGLEQGFEGSNSSIQKIDASLSSLVAGGHMKEAATEYAKWSDAAKKYGISQDQVLQAFPSYNAALLTYSDNTKTASGNTADLGQKFSVTATNAANLKGTTDELEKSISSYGSTAQSAEGATEGWYSALDTATQSVKDNGKNIDDSTAKGRANNQALYSLASAANTLADANLKAKVPIDQVKASLDAQRQTFITTAEKMGYTADAATNLANKLIGVTTTKYNFSLDGVDIATNSLKTYLAQLAKIPGKVSTTIQLSPGGRQVFSTGGAYAAGRVVHFAGGGQYRGPGTGTSDSIPAMVSNGEVVSSAATVARLGVSFFQNLEHGGKPAPTYMTAPSPRANVMQITVPVVVSGSLIGNEDFMAKTVTTAVQKGLKSGVIPANWNSN